MAKKVKKKIHIHWKAIFVFLLIGGISFLGFYEFSKLPIRNIYVEGNRYLSDQKLLEIAGIDDYPSFYWTSSASMKRKVLGNPYVKEVEVTKKWFNQVYLKVEEYPPLFRKQSDQKIILANHEELEDDGENVNLPILVNYVPDTKYESLIDHMAKVNEDVRSQISEFEYNPNEHDKDRFLLYMDDGNLVYLTLTKFKQINYYDEVLPQLEGKKGILYLDSGNHFKIME